MELEVVTWGIMANITVRTGMLLACKNLRKLQILLNLI